MIAPPRLVHMTAGNRQAGAAGMDRRPGHVAGADRLGEVDDDAAGGVHVAQRREAGTQAGNGIAGGAQGHLGVGQADDLRAERVAVLLAAVGQVNVQVDHAGDQRRARGVDDLSARRDLDLALSTHRGDPVALGDHCAKWARRRTGPVDHAADQKRLRHTRLPPLAKRLPSHIRCSTARPSFSATRLAITSRACFMRAPPEPPPRCGASSTLSRRSSG